MPKLVNALLDWSPVRLTGKYQIIMPEEAFIMVESSDNLPIRDLYTLDNRDRDDRFHLDMVKEP